MSGALPPRQLERFEALARDLVDAYGPGDPGALQRIVEYLRAERAVGWDRPPHDVRLARLRTAVRKRLDDRHSADASETFLALDSARWLIARSEGFDGWDELVKEVEA
jgi:hypothetical protein